MAKATLFDDDDDSGSEKDFGKTARGQELKINEEYAKRFEHNKKRAELHRLEDKYKPKGVNGDDEDESESSSDEDEDEDGFLATEAVDAEWAATLAAIKNKDPKIYDPETKFFHALDTDASVPKEKKKEKPVTLHDYHRERYMAGDTGADDGAEPDDAPKTFVEEQADLKKELLAKIEAEAGADEGDDDDDDDDFVKPKPGQAGPSTTTAAAAAAAAAANGMHPARQAKSKAKAQDLDITLADRDPDLYLSNYMEARAWAAADGGPGWAAFESDEDGAGHDGADADEWEAAYNLRFEDPAKSNEVLTSYSRRVVTARSVRRDAPTGRRRLRELERERKEEAKRQRRAERARLKRLKVEEAEAKLAKIKKAAGLRGKALQDDEWLRLLEDAWENDRWEEEMGRRFGAQYYAELDVPDSDAEEGASKKRRKPKKPRWDDDIDIKDIIPDFEDDDAKPNISLSDIEDDDEADAAQQGKGEDEEGEEDEDLNSDLDSVADAPPSRKRRKTTTTKALKAARQSSKRASRQERAKLEALVDAQLELHDPAALRRPAAEPAGAGFRYRETSPQAFGLTPRDILLAPSDAALNEFAGLKKLATFRDRTKKQKDRKRLGKKARLREWRREVFGREFEHSGPTFGFSGAGADSGGKAEGTADEEAAADGEGGKKKRKRSKGKKKGVK